MSIYRKSFKKITFTSLNYIFRHSYTCSLAKITFTTFAPNIKLDPQLVIITKKFNLCTQLNKLDQDKYI